MTFDEMQALKEGDRIIEKQSGSTTKEVIAAHWPYFIVTKPAFGDHPVRRIRFSSLKRYDKAAM